MREATGQRLTKIVLGGLVFLLGVQSMRFLFASAAWYLRDTLGIATLDLIPVALAPFLLAILIPAASRWFGIRASLMVSLWMLALSRIGLQYFTSPAADFWMSASGTLAFVASLPLLLSLGRSTLVGGVLLGLAVDSGIKGMFFSLDLAYQPGLLALLTVIVAGGAVIYMAMSIDYMPRRGVGWRSGVLLVGLGPFLLVEYLILQNQGWVAEVTGVSGPTAALRISILNVLTLLVVTRLYASRVALAASVAIVVGTVALAEGDATAFNVLSLAAVPAAGLMWAAMVPRPTTEQIASSAIYLTAGATAFVILGFAYYLPLDIDIGFDAPQVRVAVAIVFAFFPLLATVRGLESKPGVDRVVWVFGAAAALLPTVALLSAAVSDPVPPGEAGETVRVMSYNLHSAFNTDGSLDVEAIARVIEDSGADVIGLQEVPRGRLLSGNTDLLFLLTHELGYEFVAFFGTTDPTWGNAILSRYPISDVERTLLPKAGTPMQRGYLEAVVVLDNGPLVVGSTHLQHINDPDTHDEDPEADLYPVHHAQIGEIIAFWDGQMPAVLVGDFNARPDWRQIEELLDAGWVDAWSEAGVGDGFTSSSDNPEHRIDYVFITSDVSAVDAGVLLSQASDHLPVVVDVAIP